GGVAVELVVALGHVASGGVDRGPARRSRDRVRFLQDHGRQQGRAESRDAKAPSRKGRRGEPGRGSDRESGGKEGSESRARAAAGAGSQARRTGARKKASRGAARSDRRRARQGRSQEARAEKGRRQAADPAEEARPTDAQVRSRAGRSVDRQARLGAARRRRRDPQQRALARLVERRRGAAVAERTGSIARAAGAAVDGTGRRKGSAGTGGADQGQAQPRWQ